MTAWSRQSDAIMRALYPTTSAKALARHLGRTPGAIKQRAKALGVCTKPEWLEKTRQINLFHRGQTPWNKGRSYDPGGRSRQTRFKPRHKTHTWRQIGHDRISKDGYRQRKLTDTGCTRRDYVFIHRLVWRWHGNELPAGHALIFIDGDKTNCDINNLQLLSRAELMRRNSVHRLPRELAELAQLKGALVRVIRNREKTQHEQHQQRPESTPV